MLKVNHKDISSNEANLEGVPSGLNNKTSFSLSYTCPSCDRLEYKIGSLSEIKCDNNDNFEIYSSGEVSLENISDGEIKLCIRGFKKNNPQVVFYQQEYNWTKDTLPPSISFSLNENLFSGSLNESASVEIETDTGESIPSDVTIEQCVGTAPDVCDVSDWTTANQAQASSLQNNKMSSNKIQLSQSLTGGETYYSNVRLKDGAGNTSEIVSGSGWKATSTTQFNQLCFDQPVSDVLDDTDAGITYYVGKFKKLGLCANKLALFEANGRLVTEKQNIWDNIDGRIDMAISDGQGGWFIGGSFTISNHSNTRNLAHIKSDMTVDTSFQIRLGSTADSVEVLDMKIDDGFLYVGGHYSEVNANTNIYNLVRISMADFTVDTGWITGFGYISSFGSIYKLQASTTKIYILYESITNAEARILEISKQTNSSIISKYGTDYTGSISDFIVIDNTLYLVGKDFGYDCDMYGCNQFFNNFIKVDLNTSQQTDLSSYTADTPDRISQIQKIGDYFYYISNKKLHKINFNTYAVTKNILPDFLEVQKLNVVSGKILVEGLSSKSDDIQERKIYRIYNDSYLSTYKNLSASINHEKIALDSSYNILNYNINSILSKTRIGFAAVDRSTHEILTLQIHFDSDVNKIIKNGNTLAFAGRFQKVKSGLTNLQSLNGMLLYNLVDNQMEAINYGTANLFQTIDAIEKYGDYIFFGGNFKFTSSNNETATSLIYEDIFSYNVVTKKSKARSFYTSSLVKSLLVHQGKLFVGGTFTSVRSTSPTTNMTRRHLVSYDLTQDSWPLHNYNSNFTANPGLIRHLKSVGTNIFVEGMYNSLHYIKILNPSAAAMTVEASFNPTFSKVSSVPTFSSCDIKDGVLYAYGTFDGINGQNQNNFAMVNITNGLLVTTPAWLSPLNNGGQYNYNMYTKFIFGSDRLYIPGLNKIVNSTTLNGLGVFKLSTESLVY